MADRRCTLMIMAVLRYIKADVNDRFDKRWPKEIKMNIGGVIL